jgi:hypothetical protein
MYFQLTTPPTIWLPKNVEIKGLGNGFYQNFQLSRYSDIVIIEIPSVQMIQISLVSKFRSFREFRYRYYRNFKLSRKSDIVIIKIWNSHSKSKFTEF